MTQRFLRSASAVLLLSATLAATPACAASRSRVYVRVGPPAPIVETRVIAPGPGYVWIPGYHRWSGSAYVWVPGRWDRPPRARRLGARTMGSPRTSRLVFRRRPLEVGKSGDLVIW